jgi:hypothetical protein
MAKKLDLTAYTVWITYEKTSKQVTQILIPLCVGQVFVN